MNINDKDPRLVQSSRGWYIDYYIWNEKSQTYDRKRYSKGFKSFRTVSQKRKYANQVIEQLRGLLKEGYVVGSESLSVKVAYIKYHEWKKKSVKRPANFLTFQNHFFPWLDRNGYGDLCLSDLSRKIIHLFLDDYIIGEQEFNEVTYNRYLYIIKEFLNYYIDREEIEKNAAKGIKRLKEKDSSLHKPYKLEEVALIQNECIVRGEHQLLLFISLIFYAFLRKSELTQLRVGDVLDDVILVPGETGKNKKTRPIKLAPGLTQIISEQGLRNYPQDYFVFSTDDGRPGVEPIRENFFYLKFTSILEVHGLKRKGYTMYGLKHSGVIALYTMVDNFQDLRVIQEMCRHKSLDMTQRYLRKLGIILPIDYSIIDRFPKVLNKYKYSNIENP
ncbi:hypothetical protein BKI52_02770 [marine bacterium AO1-C]|nr:hypothetical protein BKI52_02770 [marine bacterium AO1-C]